MFTRKISADTFDQSLLNERKRNTTDPQPQKLLEPEVQARPSFDPETGEIFENPNLHFPESGRPNVTRPFSQKTLFPGLQHWKINIEKAIPTIILNLILVVALAWLAHGLMTESNTKITAQTNQLKQIKQGQSDILDAIDDLHDNLSENLLELLSSTSPLGAVKANVSNINITPSASPPIKQRSFPPKPTKLNGIKYLGSIKRHDMHQVLLEVDGKIMTLRIGDPVKAGWILSAIDEKKIIATTLFGDRQVIDLTKSGQ